MENLQLGLQRVVDAVGAKEDGGSKASIDLVLARFGVLGGFRV